MKNYFDDFLRGKRIFVLFGLSLLLSINPANADQYTQTSKYHELIFQAEFPSDYPKYPHSNNKQKGTVYAYKKHADTSSKKRFTTLASQALKRAVLANSTLNPFKKIYAYAYTSKNKTKIMRCPALSFPFELDSNSATKEWVISSSLYLCLSQRGMALDSIPHMWILQRRAGKYRILMEADGYIKIFGKSLNNYNDILAYIYQSRTSQNASFKCGGPMNMWFYQKDQYQLANASYHAQDCNYKNTSGNAWVNLNKSYLREVKPRAKKLMARIIQTPNFARAPSSATGLEDLISNRDLIKLLK